MSLLLDDNLYNKILTSDDEDFIFDNFIPQLPHVMKYLETIPDQKILLMKRVFTIINKILNMFFNSNDLSDINDENKNELLNVKSCTEYIVAKLNEENVDINNRELIDSAYIVFKYFENLNEKQKDLNESFEKLNNSLEKGTESLEDTLKLKKISDYCKDNINKSKDEINFEELNQNIEIVSSLLRKFDKEFLENFLENFSQPESKPENLEKIKAYNTVVNFKLLQHIKKKNI